MITISETGVYVNHVYTPIPWPLIGDTGYTEVLHTPWCRDLFVQVDVAGLGSGDSIDIAVEGSLDNASDDSYDNLNASGLATTIDSNGTTLLKFSGAVPPYLRFRVTGAAGTLEEATISQQAYLAIIS